MKGRRCDDSNSPSSKGEEPRDVQPLDKSQGSVFADRLDTGQKPRRLLDNRGRTSTDLPAVGREEGVCG